MILLNIPCKVRSSQILRGKAVIRLHLIEYSTLAAFAKCPCKHNTWLIARGIKSWQGLILILTVMPKSNITVYIIMIHDVFSQLNISMIQIVHFYHIFIVSAKKNFSFKRSPFCTYFIFCYKKW